MEGGSRMSLYLQPLTEQDGMNTYYMLQAIGRDENGSFHEVNGMSQTDYVQWLKKHSHPTSQQLPGEENCTSYWLMENGEPIGFGTIRKVAIGTHPLREEVRLDYAVMPSQQGKGHGTALLKLLLEECEKHNIPEVEISANQDNERSNRVIRQNGGVLCKTRSGKNIYHIRCFSPSNRFR